MIDQLRTVGPTGFSDRDPVICLAIDCARLAIADYLAGPRLEPNLAKHYASAEDFLRRTGLLERVHECLGMSVHLEGEFYRQLALSFEEAS